MEQIVQSLIHQINLYNSKSIQIKSNDSEKRYAEKLDNIRLFASNCCKTMAKYNNDFIHPSPIDSIEFRTRFCILVIQDAGLHINKMIGHRLRRDDVKSKKMYDVASYQLDDIFNKIMSCCIAILNDEHQYYLKLMTHMLLQDTSVNGCMKSYNEIVINAVMSISEDGIADDIMIDSIAKIAYMLASGSNKLKDMHSFNQIEGIRFGDDASELIRTIGNAVIIRKNKGVYAKGFQLFEQATPSIDINSRSLMIDELMVTGIKALRYFQFIMHGSDIDSCIELLL